jgi:AAA domain
VLIWVNGPFGGGKTMTAHELVRRLPGAVLCDPEHVGFGMHRMLPPALRGDFQDLPVWRTATHDLLARTLRGQDGPVVVPMTLVVPEYYAEIIGRLRDSGHRVEHFALLAHRETVVRRLRERVVGRVRSGFRGPETFALRRLDECLAALRGPEFAEQVWTDRLTVPQVADRIADAAGLTLRPNTDSALRDWARRKWTGVRHIRWD